VKRVETWIPESIEKELKIFATSKGLKLSEAIRMLLVEGLKKGGKDEGSARVA